MKLSFAAKTDIGMKRKNNEDNLTYHEEIGLFVVADGMGGHLAGETASSLAVETIYDYFNSSSGKASPPLMGEMDDALSDEAMQLTTSIRLANRIIYEAAQKNEAQRGMGTTIVVLWATPKKYIVGHVGDSRLYLIRDYSVEQITQDHSFVAEQIKKGMITEEEAKTSEMRNVLTRVLGGDADVDVDIVEVTAQKDDILLLCSDGLTNMLNDQEILSVILAYEDNMEPASERLIELANERGGNDNITLILIKVIKTGGHIKKYFRTLMKK